jgi:uncharacterized protein (DUF58 family)
MWLRDIFRRRDKAALAAPRTALDEQLLRRLERLGLSAARELRGGLSGTHPSRRRLPAPTFSDHRPYSTGDDLRYVDWNAYARLDDLHLKLGEPEQDIGVTVLIDSSASMDWGSGDRNKLHYARLLAAMLGYVALANGDRLRVIPFGGQDNLPATAPWGPGSGRQRVVGLLRYLDGLIPGGTATPAARLRELMREQRGGYLVLISDLWHSPDLILGDSPALSPFHLPRWQVLMLQLLHPQELRPDLRGDVELVDSETGARLTLEAGRASLSAYAGAVDRWCDAVASACARRGITYARITTDMPLETAALPYLRTREVLR